MIFDICWTYGGSNDGRALDTEIGRRGAMTFEGFDLLQDRFAEVKSKLLSDLVPTIGSAFILETVDLWPRRIMGMIEFECMYKSMVDR